MRILYKVGTTEYVLADGSARGPGLMIGPSGIEHRVSRLVQIDPLVGADYQVPKSKNNRSRTYSFNAEVELATIDEAQQFASTYPDSIPDEGELYVISTTEQGTERKKRFTPACVSSIAATQLIGVRLQLRFDFVCGRVEDVA